MYNITSLVVSVTSRLYSLVPMSVKISAVSLLLGGVIGSLVLYFWGPARTIVQTKVNTVTETVEKIRTVTKEVVRSPDGTVTEKEIIKDEARNTESEITRTDPSPNLPGSIGTKRPRHSVEIKTYVVPLDSESRSGYNPSKNLDISYGYRLGDDSPFSVTLGSRPMSGINKSEVSVGLRIDF